MRRDNWPTTPISLTHFNSSINKFSHISRPGYDGSSLSIVSPEFSKCNECESSDQDSEMWGEYFLHERIDYVKPTLQIDKL